MNLAARRGDPSPIVGLLMLVRRAARNSADRLMVRRFTGSRIDTSLGHAGPWGTELRGRPRRQLEQAGTVALRPRRRHRATPQADPAARPRRCPGRGSCARKANLRE